MRPTPRLEAAELAQLRIEEDASPLIRLIESKIMLWQGEERILINLPKDISRPIVNYVTELYTDAGWTVAASVGAGTSYMSLS